jgi:hypothetical protein
MTINERIALVEGYWDVTPRIGDITFPDEGHIRIELEDGRVITCPLDRFPSIQRLSAEQRHHWFRFGNGFSFDDSEEVIHMEQILGNFASYRHENE